MNAHVLAEIVVAAEVLATARVRALVRFFVGMDAANMSLEVFAPSEALATPWNFASVLPGRMLPRSVVLSVRTAFVGYRCNSRNTTTAGLFGEVRNRDRDREGGGCSSSTAGRGASEQGRWRFRNGGRGRGVANVSGPSGGTLLVYRVIPSGDSGGSCAYVVTVGTETLRTRASTERTRSA
jgi:hypothetical protein